jgi:hypothetical protein
MPPNCKPDDMYMCKDDTEMLNLEPSEVWHLVHNMGTPVHDLARRHAVKPPAIFELLARHAPIAKERDWQSITGRPTRRSAERSAMQVPENCRIGCLSRVFDHGAAAAAVHAGESCRSVAERLGVSPTRVSQVARRAMAVNAAALA